jgi:hypothetical protein
VSFNDTLANGQAQAVAAGFAGTSLIDTVEALEYVGAILFGNAA